MIKEETRFVSSTVFEGMTSIRSVIRGIDSGKSDRRIQKILFDKDKTIKNAKNIGYLDKSLYNYVIHDKSTLHTCSDKNLCMFKSIDSVKKLLKNLGLAEELKKEFDAFILRFVTMHTKQIKTISKLHEICKNKLTPEQNRMIQERFMLQQKIGTILGSLLAKR